MGGARLRRALTSGAEAEPKRWQESPSLPAELVDSPSVRPFLWIVDQPCAHWVLPDIFPFLGAAFLAPHSMMPATGLKTPVVVLMQPAKRAFPVGDPLLNRKAAIKGTAETVEMIRHEEVIAHGPAIRVSPRCIEMCVGFTIGQPFASFERADREKYDGRRAGQPVDSGFGILAARFVRRHGTLSLLYPTTWAKPRPFPPPLRLSPPRPKLGLHRVSPHQFGLCASFRRSPPGSRAPIGLQPLIFPGFRHHL